jgi:hypothetical protein
VADAVARISGHALDFGDQAVGTSGPTLRMEVANGGVPALPITGAALG